MQNNFRYWSIVCSNQNFDRLDDSGIISYACTGILIRQHPTAAIATGSYLFLILTCTSNRREFGTHFDNETKHLKMRPEGFHYPKPSEMTLSLRNIPQFVLHHHYERERNKI